MLVDIEQMAGNSVVRAMRNGGGIGGALAVWALLLAASCSTGGGKGGSDGNGGVPVASETGQDHGSAYFRLEAGPPHDFFIGAWTHVVPPMGSGPKGDDYPFGVFCAEGEISFVSGNFITPYSYNANIMTFDRSGNYIADYAGLQATDTTEAICRDWVYLGWHFQRTSGSTNVTQYVKYVGSPNPVDSTVVENVPGEWTPTRVCVGTDPERFAGTPMYIMYARIYARDTPPSAAEVEAIYQHSATPDPNAWADWPLLGGSPADFSGHGRDLSVIGNVAAGMPGPPVSH